MYNYIWKKKTITASITETYIQTFNLYVRKIDSIMQAEREEMIEARIKGVKCQTRAYSLNRVRSPIVTWEGFGERVRE